MFDPLLADPALSRAPFSEDIAAAQLELLELKESTWMRPFLRDGPKWFYALVPLAQYPQLRKIICKLLTMVVFKYYCKSIFSMKFMKSKHRTALTEEHLWEQLAVALASEKLDPKLVPSNVHQLLIVKSNSYCICVVYTLQMRVRMVLMWTLIGKKRLRDPGLGYVQCRYETSVGACVIVAHSL